MREESSQPWASQERFQAEAKDADDNGSAKADRSYNRWDYQLPRTEAPILTPEEARQGVVSGHVLMILVTSLELALIAFVILYATEIV